VVKTLRVNGDDLPPAYVDGWMAHKNSVSRNNNPYNIMRQFASYELWMEGWTARNYAGKNNEDMSTLDDYVPRVTL